MTTPYVTGTVSVTAGSAIVTGTGTGWQTAGLVAGVFGLDSANGNPIPVLSVDSDTQITLAKPWRGTTASGQAYWITYDTTAGQQTVSNAQRLAEYIARLDKPALAALASLVPAADKLPYFGPGGAGALTDFPAAARSLLAGGVLPNSQLPSRLQQSGKLITNANDFKENGWAHGENATGAPTNNGSGDWWLYNNVMGLPGWGHQTARYFFANSKFIRFLRDGVWTAWFRDGSVIERSSNANGEYVRFADGTQICTISTSFSNRPVQSAYGSMFRSDNVTLFFPASFYSPPSFAGGIDLGADILAGCSSRNIVANAANIYLWSAQSIAAGVFSQFDARCVFVGRWY